MDSFFSFFCFPLHSIQAGCRLQAAHVVEDEFEQDVKSFQNFEFDNGNTFSYAV